MKLPIFLIPCFLCINQCFSAILTLTAENVTLPTKTKDKYVDMKMYRKTVVNDSSPLNLTFKLGATDNAKNEMLNVTTLMQESSLIYYFNDEEINFKERTDVVKVDGEVIAGKKSLVLTFTKFNERIIGKYTLLVKMNNGMMERATGYIFGPPFLNEFENSRRDVEGNRMSVMCNGFSMPPIVDMEWSQDDKSSSPSYRLVPSNNTKFKNTIVWDFLVPKDAGYYTCTASNDFGNDTIVLLLRVRSRLAPLWPFIGIIIEVSILVVIIVFYERNKSKKEVREILNNPARQSLLNENKTERNQSVRHRNSPDA